MVSVFVSLSHVSSGCTAAAAAVLSEAVQF